MTDPVQRARALSSTIQITMVSIIVAFSLQEWLQRLPTIDALWEPTQVAMRIACQALIAFLIILKIWSGFLLSSVMNERVPTAMDLLGPIAILVFVDAQIASIGVDHVLRFWYVLGAGSMMAAAFISGQMSGVSFGPEIAAITSRFGARGILRNPVAIEMMLASVALLVGVLHQTVELSESGLMAASVLFLGAEALSATGSIFGWRALRKLEKPI